MAQCRSRVLATAYGGPLATVNFRELVYSRSVGWIRVRRGRFGAAKSPDPPSVRLAASLPSYCTVNFQLLFWLPSVAGIWSRNLPARSCAPLVTTAL